MVLVGRRTQKNSSLGRAEKDIEQTIQNAATKVFYEKRT